MSVTRRATLHHGLAEPVPVTAGDVWHQHDLDVGPCPMCADRDMTMAAGSIVALSNWLDEYLSQGRTAEALLLHRNMKVCEEAGEVIEALIAATDANPRKPGTDGLDRVIKEQLDVAVSALGAVEHMTGAQGRSVQMMLDHADQCADRVGLRAGTPAAQQPQPDRVALALKVIRDWKNDDEWTTKADAVLSLVEDVLTGDFAPVPDA